MTPYKAFSGGILLSFFILIRLAFQVRRVQKFARRFGVACIGYARPASQLIRSLIMTGTQRTSAELDPRRRRILFRSWRRGTREMDLIMGGFADENLRDFTEEEVEEFERIIEVLDLDLYRWINGEEPVPAEYDTPLMRRLMAFQAHTLLF